MIIIAVHYFNIDFMNNKNSIIIIHLIIIIIIIVPQD